MGETTSTITGFDWTSIQLSDFQPLIDGIKSVLGIVIAVSIPLVVIRKGWSFLKGNIYSA